MGNPLIRTPNADALTREGIAFSRCFSQATVCTPSRCSFFTGQYPHVRGHRTMHHMLTSEEPFLLSELKKQGYYVWWAGVNDVVRQEDRDRTVSECFHPGKAGARPSKSSAVKPGHHLFYAHYAGLIDGNSYISHDEACVAAAVEFLRGRPPEPFCLCLTLHDPHVPFQVEEPYYSMYDRTSLPTRIPKPENGKTEHMDIISELMGMDRLTDEDFRELLAVYYGMITKTDALLGRLADSVKENGYWEDSAVFVFSDHGEYAGDYGLVEKTQCTFEDDLTRVPLIVKFPSSVQAPRRDEPSDALVDVYATVAELAQLPNNHTHFGRSLLPIGRGKTDHHRDEVFSEGGARMEEPHTHEQPVDSQQRYWPRMTAQTKYPETHGKAVMVRTAEWKYVKRLYEDDELYHLLQDPDELHNVAGIPRNAAVIGDLNERLARWYLDTCDVAPYRLDARSSREKLPDYTQSYFPAVAKEEKNEVPL
jgi:arylsulfatase A-like enzyme